MAVNKDKPTQPQPLHRVLRETFRHYMEFKAYVASSGNHVIDHGYFIYDDDGRPKAKVSVTLSFWDLHNGLKDLPKRKKQAVYYNVIRDWKQKDVAEIMNITTVSVGQYVEAAMISLAERYFAENGVQQRIEIIGAKDGD